MTLPDPLPFQPGALLTSPDWLAARVADAGKLWRTTDLGIAATLWWYSASVVLLRPAVHAFVETGRATSVLASDLLVTRSPFGLLERVVTGPDPADVAAGPAAFGAHLDDALEPILASLAAVGAVPIQRLWALASDALGNRLLAELQSRPGLAPAPGPLTELARSIAAGSAQLQAPSYDEVSTGPGRTPMTYLHRGSCCMIFRLPGQEVCISCPRQDPGERERRLEAHARST